MLPTRKRIDSWTGLNNACGCSESIPSICDIICVRRGDGNKYDPKRIDSPCRFWEGRHMWWYAGDEQISAKIATLSIDWRTAQTKLSNIGWCGRRPAPRVSIHFIRPAQSGPSQFPSRYGRGWCVADVLAVCLALPWDFAQHLQCWIWRFWLLDASQFGQWGTFYTLPNL